MFRSSGVAPDGLAFIEVDVVHKVGGRVLLSGSACVPEGTLLYSIVPPRRAPTTWQFATASAGGPERGDWRLDLAMPTTPSWIVLSTEDSATGGSDDAATVVIEMQGPTPTKQRAVDDLV